MLLLLLTLSLGPQDPISLGPLGGSASAVVVDPTNDQELRISSWPDGLLRSADGGRTFARHGAGLPAGATPSALVPDPSSPARLYALVDDAIYVSPDFGAGWSPLSFTAASSLSTLSVSPSGQTLLAADGNNLYRSPDAGATWANVHAGVVFERVVIAPSNPQVCYAASLNGVERSDDGGQTWSHPGGLTSWAMAMLVDPADEDLVYAGGFGGAFSVSTDGGATFTPRGSGLPSTSFVFLELDPGDPARQTIWAGLLDGIWVTQDGGFTWTEMNGGFGGNYPPIPLALAFDGAGGRKLGTEGGFFIAEAGRPRWEQTGFPNVELFDATIVRPGGGRLVSSARGVYGGRGPGASFAETGWVFDFGAHTNVIVADPRDPGRWLAGGVGAFIDNATVRELTDLGHTVRTPYERYGAGQVRSIAFDPSNPDRVLGGVWPAGFGTMGLIRSIDGGATWSDVPGTPGWSCAEVAWDPATPDHAVAYLDSGFWAESFDGGATWIEHSGWPAGASAAFAIDPHSPRRWFLAELGGGLWRSLDSGATWTPLGLSANWRSDLEFSPIAPDLLWYSDGKGNVQMSGDGGDTWRLVFTASDGADCTGLALDPATGNLLVATGRSAWELPEASPYLCIGGGLPGSGGIEPRHFARNGLPQLGSTTWTLAADGLLGGTSAVLYAGRNVGARPLFGGTRYALPPTLLQVTLQTGGTPGAPGAGAIEHAVAIPGNPSLAGMAVYSQVFVSDPGAVQGVAMSKGLRTVLLP